MQNLSGTETLDDTPNDSGSQCDVKESATELPYSFNPKKKSKYTIRRWHSKQRSVAVSQPLSKTLENSVRLVTVACLWATLNQVTALRGSNDGYVVMKIFVRCIQHIQQWCFLPGTKRMQQDDHSEGTAKRS